MAESARIVDMTTHARFRPNAAALARNQLAAARAAQNATPQQFAETLTALVGWPVNGAAVEAWEKTAVPPGDVLVAAGMLSHSSPTTDLNSDASDVVGQVLTDRYADLTAAYSTRSEFATEMPTGKLFDEADEIRALGLSLNVLCQSYSVRKISERLEQGTRMQLLFLDPNGEAIKAREAEEGFPQGHLSALTGLNIQTLERVRPTLSEEASDRLEIRTYDETLRFNILLVDGRICVMQPYLPEMRGVDSPTFVMKRRWTSAGLFSTYEAIFQSIWGRGEIV